jgi:hypothetical protein
MHSDVELTMAASSIAVISLTGEHDMGAYEPLRTGFALAATVISILLHRNYHRSRRRPPSRRASR